MNNDKPAGDFVRPFTVPITEEFAQAVDEVLGKFSDFETKFPDIPETGLSPDALVIKEADELGALGDPLAGARQQLHGELLNIASTSWKNAVDHIRALRHDVLMQPPPVWSPLTLARAVLESSLFTQYLLDPTISINMRLARYAGLVATDLDHQRKTARALEEEPLAQAAIAKFRARMADCQIQERVGKTGKVCGYGVGGANAPLDMNITERAAAVLPEWLPSPYSLTSGAAHGRPWMIHRASMIGQKNESGFEGEAATIMTAAMVVMGSLEGVLPVWGSYFGLEMTDVVAEMEGTRMAFLHRAIEIVHPEWTDQRE